MHPRNPSEGEKVALVEIAHYNSAWPGLFTLERDLLQTSLAPWLVGDIEHIGSTAVPHLAAKPIIDIMAPIENLKASLAAIEAAEHAGYVYHPYKPDVMHWFCKPSPAYRAHHLHLVPISSELWRERLAFRDALRRNAALAAEYQELKLRLAATHRHDREAYTNAKSSFVNRVLAGAL